MVCTTILRCLRNSYASVCTPTLGLIRPAPPRSNHYIWPYYSVEVVGPSDLKIRRFRRSLLHRLFSCVRRGERVPETPRRPATGQSHQHLCCMHHSVSFQTKNVRSADRPPPLGPWSHVNVLLVQLVQLAPEQTHATTGCARRLRSMAEFTRGQNTTHTQREVGTARSHPRSERSHATPWPYPIENTRAHVKWFATRHSMCVSRRVYRRDFCRHTGGIEARSVSSKETLCSLLPALSRRSELKTKRTTFKSPVQRQRTASLTQPTIPRQRVLTVCP